jgi:Flp pilus assembly protein TadG
MLRLTVFLLLVQHRVVTGVAGPVGGGGRGAVPPAAPTRRSMPTIKARQPPTWAGDRGAAAVEFALLLPVLLLMVFGIIDFGRALNAQITLTQAAREGVRLAAVGQPVAAVVARTQAAATTLTGVTVAVTSCPAGAGLSATAVVKASYQFSFITPIGAIAALVGGHGLGHPLSLSATGEMPCET